MNCSGYTIKNQPCKNKVQKAGEMCYIHESGLTLLSYDLERIKKGEPFELRQGDRTYYISLDETFDDILKGYEKTLNPIYELQLKITEEAEKVKKRCADEIMELKNELKHSISYDILRQIKKGEPFELIHGDRSYYISLNESIDDIRRESEEALNVVCEIQKQTIEDAEEFQKKLVNEIIELKNQLQHSISYNTIRKIKEQGCLNFVVENPSIDQEEHFVISRKPFLRSIFDELNDKKDEIKKLNKEIANLNNFIKFKKNEKPSPKIKNLEFVKLKKEHQELKNSIDSFKKRIDAHAVISRECYKYEVFDGFINETIERITKHKRDYGAGIYNKISDFMRIKNINKICHETLGISSSDFYDAFNDLREKRNEIAHPKLKNKDIKNLTKAINHYLKNT